MKYLKNVGMAFAQQLKKFQKAVLLIVIIYVLRNLQAVDWVIIEQIICVKNAKKAVSNVLLEYSVHHASKVTIEYTQDV